MTSDSRQTLRPLLDMLVDAAKPIRQLYPIPISGADEFDGSNVILLNRWEMSKAETRIRVLVEHLIENLPMDRAKPVKLALQEFQHALDAALSDLAGHIETAVERE